MSASKPGVWPCNFCPFWSNKKIDVENHETRNHADRLHESMKRKEVSVEQTTTSS